MPCRDSVRAIASRVALPRGLSTATSRNDPPRPQQRQAVEGGARRLARAVPGDEHAVADGPEIAGDRHDQHRPAGAEHQFVGTIAGGGRDAVVILRGDHEVGGVAGVEAARMVGSSPVSAPLHSIAMPAGSAPRAKRRSMARASS